MFDSYADGACFACRHMASVLSSPEKKRKRGENEKGDRGRVRPLGGREAESTYISWPDSQTCTWRAEARAITSSIPATSERVWRW